MWRWRRLFLKITMLLRRRRAEEEMTREVNAHLALIEDEFERRGMSSDDAMRAARRAFGGIDRTKELHREARSVPWLEHALQDLRYACRSCRRNPGFSLITVITLATGIGATTTIFSVLSAVLLRPLSYPESHRLVRVWSAFLNDGSARGPSALPDYRAWRMENRVFDEVGAYHFATYNLTGVDRPERLQAFRMTASMWSVLKAQPSNGALFSEGAEAWGQNRVAVLSDGLWRRRFGGDPSAVGRQVQLNGQTYTIIAIMPPTFQFPSPRTELWTPISYAPGDVMDTRNNHFVEVLGRLKANVSAAQAQADLSVITAQIRRQFPENANIDVTSAGLQETIVGDVRLPLLLLMGSVIVVLLIACSNVANLTLARAAVRQREITLREALGAGRGRLVRQLLTESLLLAFIGTSVGLIFTFFFIQELPALAPIGIPRLREVEIDRVVLAVACGLSVLTGVGFGLFPAWQATRTDVSEGLKQGARTFSTARSSRRISSSLVIGEIALSLMLLIGAGLLIASLVRIEQIDPGFKPDHLLTSRIDLSPVRYREPERIAQFVSGLVDQTSALPGVVSAGLTTSLPLAGGSWGKFITVDGRPAPSTLAEVPHINYSQVTPGYFRAIGATLRRGRFFSSQDGPRQPAVAIIDEAVARRFWPDDDPIGKRISLFPPASLMRDVPDDWPGYLKLSIVGVVGNVRQNGLENNETLAQVFVPVGQARDNVSGQDAATSFSLVVRTSNDPRQYRQAIEDVVFSIDRSQPVANWQTMESLLSDSLMRRRFVMQLLTAFAVVAIVLAVVGIYGLVTYTVTQRHREMGIRLALGATASSLNRLVLCEGLKLGLAGVTLGLALAAPLSRFISSQLFNTPRIDPLLYGMAATSLLLVCVLASGLPAARAARVDPAVTLRQEQ